MNCITLTLNPAFDRHCYVPNFRLYREHLATSDECEAGGKGVNISRALTYNNVDNLAVVVMGRENEAQFSAALDKDGLDYVKLSVEGRVRENLTIHTNGDETRVSFAGFSCDDSLLDKVYDLIADKIDYGTLLTFTGRLPGGVSLDATMAFLSKIADKGAKIVIDSKSFVTLEQLVAAKPWLIKPNQEEISEYLGREIESFEEIVAAARDIHARGIENVMISLGAKGALLVCSEGAFICTPPKVEVRSAIGAGDSSIGGFIAATLEGKSAKEAICLAVSYGSAACIREGTLPPLGDDIEAVLKNVKIEALV